MPTHLPGLVRYLKGAIELAKPLLVNKFPISRSSRASLARRLLAAALILPVDERVAFAACEPVQALIVGLELGVLGGPDTLLSTATTWAGRTCSPWTQTRECNG